MQHIEKREFKKQDNPEIEVVPLAPLLASLKQDLITPHRTAFYHVFLFENCSPTHWVDLNPVEIKPYSLLFIDRDRVHQFDRLLNYDGRVLIFTDDFFGLSERDTRFLRGSILFNDLSDQPGFQLGKTDFKRFSDICGAIDRELKSPSDDSKREILKNLLHNFLLLAEREKRQRGFVEFKKGTDLDYTLLFRQLLETDFATSKNVSVYAGKMNISEKRLGQATAMILGKTPKELIDERIVLEIKRLLVHTNQSVKEIGFQLGFEEPSNFIKYFRKHSGQTPLEFKADFIPL